MSVLNKEPITKLEKWLNRIITIALAAWAAIEYLLTNWQK